MLFDKNGKFISLEHLGEGTVSSSSVSPRRILDIVFKKNASSIIIAHNHPCGKTEASITDIHVTSHLNMMLKNAGVELKNHYIIAGFDIVDCLPSSR
jgi:DNA repair protein RadC